VAYSSENGGKKCCVGISRGALVAVFSLAVDRAVLSIHCSTVVHSLLYSCPFIALQLSICCSITVHLHSAVVQVLSSLRPEPVTSAGGSSPATVGAELSSAQAGFEVERTGASEPLGST